MAEYATSIEIDAPPHAVFDYLVSADRLVSWMGEHAVLDAVPGGLFAVDIAGYPVRGRYLEVDPPHRVVVSWGFAGSDDLPPGFSRVEFTLIATAAGTRLELLHSNLPDPYAAGHARGWTHFLDRLSLASTGHPVGADFWLPQ